MLKIIPNKKHIGAELVCDLNKINNSTLKKINAQKKEDNPVKKSSEVFKVLLNSIEFLLS